MRDLVSLFSGRAPQGQALRAVRRGRPQGTLLSGLPALLPSVVFAGVAVTAALPAQAAVMEFVAGMTNSGSAPFSQSACTLTPPVPGEDACAGDYIVRTHDYAGYRVGYSLTPAESNVLLTMTIPAATIPPAYNGPPNPQVALFNYVDLPVGANGCQGIQATPVADPPQQGVSGVTADGQKAFCWQPNNSSANNQNFRMRIAGTAPNDTEIPAPIFTLTTSSGITPAPTVVLDGPSSDGTEEFYGLKPLYVSAAPRWDAVKSNTIRGALMVPGSGPNGEDGYVFSWNIGVRAVGSLKGIEALNTARFVEDYSDSNPLLPIDQTGAGNFPNARLVTWPIVNADYVTSTNITGPSTLGNSSVPVGSPRHCGNWQSQMTVSSNSFDNVAYYPVDAGAAVTSTGANADISVSRGGECVLVPGSNDTVNKTATFELIGTDFSLKHFPIYKGSARTTQLVNSANLEQPTNEFWVASKTVLVWAPLTDVVIPPGQGEKIDFLTNRITFLGESVTGQNNHDPHTDSNVNVQAAERRIDGRASKVHSAWVNFYSNPNGWDVTDRNDPNITTDSHINIAAPGQYFANRLIISNAGSEPLPAGYTCDKIDNARTTFVDARAIPSITPNNPRRAVDPATGILSRWEVGPITGFTPRYELGVGGAGITNAPSAGGAATSGSGTWTSVTTVSSPYDQANVASGTMGTSGCGDLDATWFDSIDALQAAGYTLQDVSRVRMSYDGMQPGISFWHIIPSRVNSVTAFATAVGSANAPFVAPGTVVAENSTTTDMMSTNVFDWVYSGNRVFNAANSFEIYQNEFPQITKTSPSHPNSGLVVPGSQVTYRLVANLSTSGSAHTTDVAVYDVLPPHMEYVAGSTTLGGTVFADPQCHVGPMPWPTGWGSPTTASAAIPAGYTACRWDLPGQTATKAAPGNALANLPALQFRARVSANATSGTPLLNTSFADSTNNSLRAARYAGGSTGFACVPNQTCSFSNWNLSVDAAPGAVLNKVVSHEVVPTDSDFSYQLQYGAIGNTMHDFRLIDVLPHMGDGRVPPTSFSGSFGLAGPVSATATSLEGGTDDTDVEIYYTSNTATNIHNAPYDVSHVLDGSGANSATTTNWCSSLGGSNCPTAWADVTAIYVRAKGGQAISAGQMYELKVEMSASGNTVGNMYANQFTGDSPSLTARNPGSNTVTTRVVGPDLAIAKSVSPARVTAGQNAAYEIIVRNDNSHVNAGPFLTGSITVTDPLPAGLTIVATPTGDDWNCSASTTTAVTCEYSGALPIPMGATVGGPITFGAQVPSPLGALTQKYLNTARVITPTTEVTTDNNEDTAEFTALAEPQIGTYKYIDTAGGLPEANSDGTWTVSYVVGARNYGPQDVTSFNLTDTLTGSAPNFGNHVSGTPTVPGTYTILGGSQSCSIEHGEVLPGAEYETNPGFNGDTATNLLRNATVLPAASASSPGEVSCRFAVRFAPAAGQFHFENTAIASGSADGTPVTDRSFNGSDPKGGNASELPTHPDNDVPTPLDITRSVQPTVTKTASVTQFIEGDVTPLVYTIVVGNAGSDGLNDFTVVDTPATGVTLGNWTCAVTNAGVPYVGVATACGADNGSGALNTTVDLQPAAEITYTIQATIGASVVDEAINSVTVSTPPTLPPEVTCVSDCSVENTSTVTNEPREVQPTVRKEANIASYQPYLTTAVQYSIVVGNTGPHGGTGFNVVDTPPTGVTIDSWECVVTTPGTTYSGVTTACSSASGNGAINTTVDLQPGAVVTYTVLATIADDVVGSLTNTAAVTSPPGAECTTSCLVEDDSTIPPKPFGALTVLKSVDKSYYVYTAAEETVQYTIEVTNSTEGPVVNATVADAQPAGVTFNGWTCVVSNPGVDAGFANSCTASGSGDISDTVTLNPGAVLTYTVEATIAATVREPVENVATVTVPPEQCTTAPCTTESTVTTTGTPDSTPVPLGGLLPWLAMFMAMLAGGFVTLRRQAH
ncbi:hypothetical protein E9531_03450 [Lampropedia puyangensis]|uniref:DUF11 domain-containing protein n=1 Tax=Lampropedia puyangensis TaxID=1330072 RepID=A0A4S8FB51_9BURK|nr:DUF11 domain-containing protein [Lampropedia puyangensis]THU04459.1 hypothetical protein E9531_03450 [Lampropedia puyangensis]